MESDWPGVIEDLTHILRSDPQASFGPQLGFAYRSVGDFEAAEIEYSRALSLQKEDSVLLEGRAAAREGRGDISGALEDLRAALRAAPGESSVLLSLASIE